MHRIRELTEQARCDLQVRGLPKNVVNSICEYVRQSPVENRIAPIYLIDSIVKNIGSVYIQLFEEHVEGILVSTFKHGQKKARDTVIKILKEWHRRKLFKKEVRKTIYDQLVQLGALYATPYLTPHIPYCNYFRVKCSIGLEIYR